MSPIENALPASAAKGTERATKATSTVKGATAAPPAEPKVTIVTTPAEYFRAAERVMLEIKQGGTGG